LIKGVDLSAPIEGDNKAMRAVEHLKTLCCLGLKPESAMIAVTPLLHEIIPHGWTRIALLDPDAAIRSGYFENPAAAPIIRERMWRFMDDPSSVGSLFLPAFRAVGIGWSLYLQGRGYLESGWYREIEAPLDACWSLGAMIGDNGRTIALVTLTRPRSAHPFTVDDLQRLDRLRPWLAHALRRAPMEESPRTKQELVGRTGAPVLSGQIIFTSDEKIISQTASAEHLLTILTGHRYNYTRYEPDCARLPSPIMKLLQRIVRSGKGIAEKPPRMQISNAYGTITIEAKWLVPKGVAPEDVAKDPRSCLVSVMLDLREHAIAHAARILREYGATPTQVKVGIQLALGKAKPAIAEGLAIKASSVADQVKRLYHTLEVHNSTELSTKIWLGESRGMAGMI